MNIVPDPFSQPLAEIAADQAARRRRLNEANDALEQFQSQFSVDLNALTAAGSWVDELYAADFYAPTDGHAEEVATALRRLRMALGDIDTARLVEAIDALVGEA